MSTLDVWLSNQKQNSYPTPDKDPELLGKMITDMGSDLQNDKSGMIEGMISNEEEREQVYEAFFTKWKSLPILNKATNSISMDSKGGIFQSLTKTAVNKKFSIFPYIGFIYVPCIPETISGTIMVQIIDPNIGDKEKKIIYKCSFDVGSKYGFMYNQYYGRFSDAPSLKIHAWTMCTELVENGTLGTLKIGYIKSNSNSPYYFKSTPAVTRSYSRPQMPDLEEIRGNLLKGMSNTDHHLGRENALKIPKNVLSTKHKSNTEQDDSNLNPFV